MAVDPSLTCSGWALFAVSSRELIGVGKIRSLSAEYPLAERLLDLQQKVSLSFERAQLAANDVLICESQTTMRDPHAAFKVEQVRGIFETVARSRQITVPGRINPRSVHHEVMGLSGKQAPRNMVKDAANHVVHTLYGAALKRIGFDSNRAHLKKNQDIVDAILIGSLALARIDAAAACGTSLEEFFDQDRYNTRRYRTNVL